MITGPVLRGSRRRRLGQAVGSPQSSQAGASHSTPRRQGATVQRITRRLNVPFLQLLPEIETIYRRYQVLLSILLQFSGGSGPTVFDGWRTGFECGKLVGLICFTNPIG
jgi:hypothetical protein